MKTLIFWLLWTICWGTAAFMAWRNIQRHIKVYLLILMNGLYLAGVFLIYGVMQGIPG